MASDDAVTGNAIWYTEILASKVIEGVTEFPAVEVGERQAMLELVAAKLTEAAGKLEALHAS